VAGRAGEVLVKLSGGARLDRFLEKYGALLLAEVPGTGYARCRVPGGFTVDEFLALLADDRDVVGSERNLVVGVPEGTQSNLPVLDDNLDDAAVRFQPAGDRIGLPLAHPLSRGEGIVVAVVDTGIDPTHPFLAGRILPGPDLVGGDEEPFEERDFADNDGDGLIDEGYGHGTFVAGLVCVAAPEVLILPVRVLDGDATGDSATVAQGIVVAVDRGADVVNLSLGSALPMEVVREAIRYANDRGVPVVVAAGNEADQLFYPARYAVALAVTATDLAGVAAPFTNFGSQADLAAPGVDLAGPMPPDAGAFFAYWSGTSFAAPLVSGSLAVVMRRFPVLPARTQVERLLPTSEDISPLNPGVELGEGLVRPDEAVQ
jgi:subtilisin family serine protease